nr:uncharacterized protein LOC123746584 [Procambarus clarkii]XP_045584159.1 uncharacterized protein LOC123746584 [Procambarus clarkii]XP_045584161.1 uncharacterized protein LOC123746584 [Procambarus clarkii]
MTSLDYGTLLCWATNYIGIQRHPCVFHILPAGKPEPPSNCTVWGGSRTSVRLRCVAGSSGGLSQHFLLQARLQEGPLQHFLNFTTAGADGDAATPHFLVEGLKEKSKYLVVVTAVNDRGLTSDTHLTISSLGTSGSVYQPHDGPLEAEVRDGGPVVDGHEGIDDGETDDRSFWETLTDNPYRPLILVCLGSSLLVLVILLLLGTISYRKRRRIAEPGPQDDSQDMGDGLKGVTLGASSACLAVDISPVSTKGQIPVSLVQNQQVRAESDTEPDVVLVRGSCRGCERETATFPVTSTPNTLRHQYQESPRRELMIPTTSQYPYRGCVRERVLPVAVQYRECEGEGVFPVSAAPPLQPQYRECEGVAVFRYPQVCQCTPGTLLPATVSASQVCVVSSRQHRLQD